MASDAICSGNVHIKKTHSKNVHVDCFIMLLNHLPNNKRSAEFVQTNMCVHFCKCEILLAFTSQQMLNIDYAWIDSVKCLKSSHKSGNFFCAAIRGFHCGGDFCNVQWFQLFILRRYFWVIVSLLTKCHILWNR